MYGILTGMLFLLILVIVVIMTLYFSLKEYNHNVNASKYILNKIKPDNSAPKLTDVIEFYKDHEELNKYIIK